MKTRLQQGQRLVKERDFNEAYLALRSAEQRIYSDEEVLALPSISTGHIHRKEWETRKSSAERFRAYLQKQNTPDILEVGCGNGWLTNYLSGINNVRVTGTDINITELGQARRLFGEKENLNFVYGDIRSGIFEPSSFDIVFFAASIQYFESFHSIMDAALQLLKPGGEIHLLDSIFYTPPEVEKARYRSRIYFELKGHESMQRFYFHHSLKDLQPFRYEILYHPGQVINRLYSRNNPFFWIRIKP